MIDLFATLKGPKAQARGARMMGALFVLCGMCIIYDTVKSIIYDRPSMPALHRQKKSTQPVQALRA